MDEKTISFRGIDQVSGVTERIKESMKGSFKEIIANYTNTTRASKDFVGGIEDEIKAMDRRNKLVANMKIYEARREFERVGDMGGGAKEMTAAKTAMDTGIRQAADDLRDSKLQLSLLEEIISTIERTGDEELKANKENVKEQVKLYEAGKIPEDQLDDERRLKLEYQSSVLEKEKQEKQPMGFWKTAGAMATGSVVADALKTAISSITGMTGAQTGEHAMAQMLRTIPWIGEAAAGAQQRHLESSEKAYIAYNKFKALAGRGTGMFAAEGLGFDITETMPIASELMKVSGTSGNAKQRTLDVLGLSKAYGVDTSLMMNMEKARRYGGISPMDNVNRMIGGGQFKGLGEDGDFARLGELLEQQNRLIEDQTSVFEEVDYDLTSSVMGAFERVGGSFGNDPRAAERIAQVNRSLANPSNDYQQAMNYNILSQMAPGASYYKLREMQEKGVYQKGFLSKTFETYQQQYGGKGDDNELMMEAVRNRFGLSYSQGRTLTEAYQKNPQIFDGITDKEGLEKLYEDGDKNKESRKGVMARAGEMTSGIEVKTASVTDAFVQSATKGMGMIMSQFGDAMKKTLFDVFMGENSALGAAAAAFTASEKEKGEIIIQLKNSNSKLDQLNASFLESQRYSGFGLGGR